MKFFLFLLLFLLTSCVELIDEIQLNNDGSGKFKYVINLSQSKTNVSSVLLLDSVNGKKNIKLPEIKEKILNIKQKLSKQDGISNVIVIENYTDYIIKFECDFESLEKLKTAFENSIQENNQKTENWVSYEKNVFYRKTPNYVLVYLKNTYVNYNEKLKNGTYTSIVRFENEISSFTNNLSLKSKSGKAIMTKIKPNELIENPNLLDNTILIKN
jgi:hypothetical protein